MKTFLTLIGLIAALACLYALYSFVYYILPPPFDELSIPIISVIILLLRGRVIASLFMGLSLSIMTELFSSVHFGLPTIALLATTAIIYWLLQTVFTSNNWYIVLIVGFIGIVIYRLLATVLNVIFGIIFLKGTAGTFLPTFTLFIEEALINAVAVAVIWAIGSKIFRSRRVQYDAL